MFYPIPIRKRHVQRYTRILEVLARNGFADVVERTGLDTLINRGRAILGAARKERDHLTRQERVRCILEELGPTFVKLGQVLSTRPDLIPPEWAEEFKKLQDDVPGVDYAVIEETLEAEFSGKLQHLFRFVQKEPVAAASIAQVHRAQLRDGASVVIKVLRPGVREITEADMEILRTLAEKAEAYFSDLGYSPTEVVSEFAKELTKEVDLTHEGRATERLRRLFADDPAIIFPKVYWETTTQSVLTLEEIDGIVLSRAQEGEIQNEDRRRLVENGTRAVLRQCLEFGFFHADPHPGNLLALPGGRIAFIDCGMTGQLEAATTRHLADLVAGVAASDAERAVDALAALADIAPETLEKRNLRADLNGIVREFEGIALGQLNLGHILQEFFGTLRTHHVRCPGDMVFLIKALTTIESVGRWLDPSFEIVDFARPHVERLVQERYSFSAVRSRVRRTLLQYAELLEDLPREVRVLASQLARNRLAFSLEHRGLTRLTSAIEYAGRNIAFALIIAAIIVGSSILILAASHPRLERMMTIGLAGFIVAGVLMVLMVLFNRGRRN